MDVRKLLSTGTCFMMLSACGAKSVETVFPEKNSYDSSYCSGQAISNQFIVQWEDGSFSKETATDADVFEKKFIKPQLEKIRFVEYDRKIQLSRSEVTASASADSWGQSIIQADALWNQGLQGEGVIVGVVDSAVDYTHTQLAPRIAINEKEIPGNGKDDDGNGYIDDYYGYSFISGETTRAGSGHGTHVSGIIAADSTKGNINGVAPKAKIVPAPFIGASGGGSLADAVLALQYAANRGAQIINASWGGAPCVQSLRNAFKELEQRDILIVVAAGNDGLDVDIYPEYPASFNFSNQITVAASSIYDYMTSWSNRGYNAVHIAAPGESILSTLPYNSQGTMDGTSMAAPFVTGGAALLKGAFPQASSSQIKQAILSSVDVTSGHEFKVNTQGRLNILKAYQKLSEIVQLKQ